MIEFIDLTEVNPKDPEFPHSSCLSITDKRDGLTVVGVLTHGFTFEPRTVSAALKLITWLEEWRAKQEENENRAEILESIARTLFVTAYADACEDTDEGGCQPDMTQAAGAGEDWFDTVTDETPGEARETARDIADDFEARNGRKLEAAGAQWTRLEFHYNRGPHDLESFGHYLAMTCLGHGVGLWDDYKGDTLDGFECAHAEFYL